MDLNLISLLRANPYNNIAILGFFSNYPVNEYYIEGNSALIWGKSDYLWAHIASNSETELRKLLNKYHLKTNYFFSVEDWMIPIIKEYRTIDWIMTTTRFILQKPIKLKPLKNEIKTIDRSFAQVIFNNSEYKKYTSIEYITDRLNKDISAGIFIENELVAWGFTHDDGALGFLHVIEKFRNKGFAKDILMALIQMRRNKNQPIFCNIFPDNVAPIYLVTNYGFTPDRNTSWLKLL